MTILISFRGFNFKLFIASRGIGNKGKLKTLENFPPSFHKFFTVVTSKESTSWIKKAYPNVQTLIAPSHINNAGSKRRFCLSHPGADRNWVFNDDLNLYVVDPDTKKCYRPSQNMNLWKKHLKNLFTLSLRYDAVSTKFRPFSNTNINNSRFVLENHALEFAFTVTKEALAAIPEPKYVYYDMRELNIELLTKGYSTASYYGILCDNNLNLEVSRKNSDRTLKTQVKEERSMMEHYAGIVVPKRKTKDGSGDGVTVKWANARNVGLNKVLGL